MKPLKCCLFTGLLFIFILNINQESLAQTNGEKALYLDYKHPVKERVHDLLSRMTLEEKLSQMMTRIPTDLPRLGIPGYQWGGEAGHCISARADDFPTIFPVPLAQAATWDRKINFAMADALSAEARPRFHAGKTKSTLTFWAPVVEMARDPRWGRTEECYGEDPYLTSQLSLQFVKGIQGNDPKYLKGIAAPKHFALNNEEWCRHNGSSETDEQLLREYYLKPYQFLVQEGKAEQIMAAYNRLNGVPCTGNKWLLTDVLRKDWGFDGNVVSDCNGIMDFYQGHKYVANVEEAIALALNSGMDIECGDCFRDNLAKVVKKGLVSEAVIDSAVFRILVSRFRMGLYDPAELVQYTKIPISVVHSDKHLEIARQLARESIVLLKNNGVLPIDRSKVKSVAVIGPNAAVCQLGGYTGAFSHVVSPLTGIKNKIDSTRVKYVKGTDIKINLPAIPSENLVPAGGKPGEHGLKGEYFNEVDCQGEPVLTRIDPVIDFNFGRGAPDPSLPADYYSIRWTGKFIAPVSGSYYIGGEYDDVIRLWLDGKLIIDRTNNRNKSSDAIMISLEKAKEYDIKLEYNEQWYAAQVRLGGMPFNLGKFSEAAEAAKNADVAIVVVGTDESVEKEGVDRASLSLPGDQEELIKAVFRANPHTVVVMQNGSALAVNWANDNVPAIVETWYNGEEGGNALADVLFGDYNPAGRLPLTFYQSENQLPSISDYDIRKGRTYMYPKYKNEKGQVVDIKPLYPFGYGLSYTQFSYSNLKISPEQSNSKGIIKVSVDLKNTGKLLGDEVVQVYVTDEKASVVRPAKQLAAFERIPLQPNQVKTIEFEIPIKDFAYWDMDKKAFVLEPGKFNVTIGGSSEDIRLKGQFKVTN
jgi:beta-glucosidase